MAIMDPDVEPQVVNSSTAGGISSIELFPYDLGFSMTVHKAQGRTIYRVVIDLTDHPNSYGRMEYAAIFVAMSRVEMSDHIRLFEKDPLVHRSEPYEYRNRKCFLW